MTQTIRTTYNTSSNMRDVTKTVVNVSPEETPLYSLLGNTKRYSRKIEGVTDSNAAANADNALIEGATLSDTVTNDRSFNENWMQIFTKILAVTGTQEVVIKHGGITSEMQYQVKKAYVELATDVEKALIVGTVATGSAGIARKLNGAIAIITTNTATASTSSALWTGTAAADIAAFEEKFNDLFQLMFETGKTATHVFVAGKLKRRISKLTSNVTRNINASEKKQILTIDYYDSDFGTVKIILDRYVPDTTILALRLEGWRVAYLRPFTQFPLAKVADSHRNAIVGELTLQFDDQKFGGKITAG
jgi:hypothetical protein